MKRLNGMGPQAQAAFTQHQAKIQHNTERGAYNAVLSQQQSAQISSKALITEGYLRSEIELLGSGNDLNFQMLSNQGAQSITEKRLNISDAFVVTSIALAYVVRDFTIGSVLENFGTPIITYPGAAPLANNATLQRTTELLYQSSLSMRVNQTVFFDRYDTLRFRRAGTAQRGLNVTPTVANQNNQYFTDSFEINQPFQPIVPFITFGGQDDVQVNVKLPITTPFFGEGEDLYVVPVFMCRGLLIQNAYS